MKEFVNKLIGRLEEERKKYTSEYGLIDIQVQEVFVNVRKIVKELAEEYINTSTDKSTEQPTWKQQTMNRFERVD